MQENSIWMDLWGSRRDTRVISQRSRAGTRVSRHRYYRYGSRTLKNILSVCVTAPETFNSNRFPWPFF